ncbi:MAG: hypothetical protein H0U82_08410, partial [Actinobacteria bacterium]|nr:hypothetical protein [Actinomycetota bacterium]
QFASVAGINDEVPLIRPEGVADRSIDDLLRASSTGAQVPSAEIQALILRELATGRKSRKHLNEAARDGLGASQNAVYERGLAPLKGQDKIRAAKDGYDGKWSWELRA